MTEPIDADLDGDGDLESIEGEGRVTRVKADGNTIWEHNGPIDGWNRSDDDQFRTVADVDGDGTPEILVEDPNDGWTGLWKWQGGALHAPWMARTPIDGWNRSPDDIFFPADLQGDGRQELVVFNNRDLWTGVFEWANNALQVSWKSPSPIDGWNRSPADIVYLADLQGDGRQELVVFNNRDLWTGVFEWANNALQVSWKSPSPIDGFNRGGDDLVTITDVDADGKQEVIIVAANDGWAGVFKWKDGGLHVFWASASPIGGPAGECDLHGTTVLRPKLAGGHNGVETNRPVGLVGDEATEIFTLVWNGAGLEVIEKALIPPNPQ